MNNIELREYQEKQLPQNDSQALKAIEDIGPYFERHLHYNSAKEKVFA